MESVRPSNALDNPSVMTDDVLTWRDRIVSEAAAHFEASRLQDAMDTLRGLEFATIDERTLELTDSFLAPIAAGRRVIATCDPQRRPAADEIVIIYGNYPHIFENVVVNNPIKRHIAMFGEFTYDEVEYDRRWEALDHIYIINADDRADRYDAVMRELASARAPFHRMTRISAVRNSATGIAQADGQVGCLSSHLETLRAAKTSRFNNVLVLEDDFCFTSDIDRHLDDLQAFLQRGYDYVVCLFATSKYGRIVPKDDLVSTSFQPCTNTGAYLASGARIDELLAVQEFALEKLKETHDTIKYSADRHWAILQASGRFLVFRRKLGFQIASFSDIERQITRYLD